MISKCKIYAVYQSFEQCFRMDNFKVSFVLDFIDIF
jgi:hypothetical protein